MDDVHVHVQVGILHKPGDNKMKSSNNLVRVDLETNQVGITIIRVLSKEKVI